MVKRGWLVLGGAAVVALGAVLFSAARAAEDSDKDRKEVKKVVIFRSGGSWLGVQIADIDDDRARELGLKEPMGAEIQSVSEDSPAEEAGLKKGDVILEYQGTRIEGVAQLTRLVRETPPGRSAALRVWNAGATRSVQIKVGEREHGPGRHWRHFALAPDAPEPPEPPEPPQIDLGDFDIDINDLSMFAGPHGGPRLGAVVDSVGRQLAEYFGVKQGGGVLVKSIRKGGPGDEAGLRAGDVIVRIDDEAIEDEGDLRMALRERRGKEFRLTVVRDRREQTLTIPAPPEDRSDRRRAPRQFPPEERERIRKEVEKALKEATVARAEAGLEIRRAREEAMRQAREALEEAQRAREEAAFEEAIEDAGETDEDIDSIRDERLRMQDDVRRAVEEARRIRIEMQEMADQ
jgi:membrane-associated protease RseP (regulator of RpoE activity)